MVRRVGVPRSNVCLAGLAQLTQGIGGANIERPGKLFKLVCDLVADLIDRDFAGEAV
ncbi:hypothetical protein D3C72_2265550 [compost metagenome]